MGFASTPRCAHCTPPSPPAIGEWAHVAWLIRMRASPALARTQGPRMSRMAHPAHDRGWAAGCSLPGHIIFAVRGACISRGGRPPLESPFVGGAWSLRRCRLGAVLDRVAAGVCPRRAVATGVTPVRGEWGYRSWGCGQGAAPTPTLAPHAEPQSTRSAPCASRVRVWLAWPSGAMAVLVDRSAGRAPRCVRAAPGEVTGVRLGSGCGLHPSRRRDRCYAGAWGAGL